MIWTTTLKSPVGPLLVFASERGLRGIVWNTSHAKDLRLDEAPVEDRAHPILKALRLQLDSYFEGERKNFDLPLDLVGTEFQRAAWRALLTIPYGETRSYGEQAAFIGKPKAVRAIGGANGRNPVSIVVPCHRVIGANGKLTGFGGGIDTKRFLLDLEARHGSGQVSLPIE